jgi:hypothetical protein
MGTPLDGGDGSGQLGGGSRGVAGEVREAGGPQRQLRACKPIGVQHRGGHHRGPVVEQLRLQQRRPRQRLEPLFMCGACQLCESTRLHRAEGMSPQQQQQACIQGTTLDEKCLECLYMRAPNQLPEYSDGSRGGMESKY